MVKRVIDIVVASLALVVLSPAIVVIGVLIKATSSGPILFKQRRLGKNGVSFTMYKFRTMRLNAPIVRNTDGSTFVGDKDSRLTVVGRFLRESTMDEIPQLINVLKGEMSVVGPRPDMLEHLALYDKNMKRKLEVRPGMASLPMLHGRNALSWRNRIELDIFYVDHQSVRLDCEIFVKSFLLMLLRKGIYYPSKNDKNNVN